MEIKKIKKGQEIELTISDLAFGGKGISKVNDLIFFVKDAIPNQKVLAKVNKIKKTYIEAYKIQILDKSIDEVDPTCEHFKYCGGCTLQQMDYNKQLFYKEKQVFDIFHKIGDIKNPKINSIIFQIFHVPWLDKFLSKFKIFRHLARHIIICGEKNNN